MGVAVKIEIYFASTSLFYD